MIRRFGLDFLTTAFFVALAAGFWRGRGDLVPWTVAGAVAALAERALSPTWSIVFGAVAGSLMGALRDARRSV